MRKKKYFVDLNLILSRLGVLINVDGWRGGGGCLGVDLLKKNLGIFLALKSKFLHSHFIVLNSSMGIFTKSQKVSALNFDPKGVKKGEPYNPGPKDPPPPPPPPHPFSRPPPRARPVRPPHKHSSSHPCRMHKTTNTK